LSSFGEHLAHVTVAKANIPDLSHSVVDPIDYSLSIIDVDALI
jgi:hypothetical protein